MLSGFDFVLITLAALAAGAINAIAGGGTLITFPMLVAVGIPPVAANVTNTVALCPGYFGGTLAQWDDLRRQKKRLWLVIPASIVGGVIGGFLLLQTGEKLFKELVPYLILLASGLLAIQDPVRAWLVRRMGEHHEAKVGKIDMAARWIGFDLRGIFWRRLKRDHPLCIGINFERYAHAVECFEASHRVQRQCGGGNILYFFWTGGLVCGAGDGCRRTDRRDLGWKTCGQNQTVHVAVDGGHDRGDRFDYLFCARIGSSPRGRISGISMNGCSTTCTGRQYAREITSDCSTSRGLPTACNCPATISATRSA